MNRSSLPLTAVADLRPSASLTDEVVLRHRRKAAAVLVGVVPVVSQVGHRAGYQRSGFGSVDR